jgi:hypothetical protein
MWGEKGCESITTTRSLESGNHATGPCGYLPCHEHSIMSIKAIGIAGEYE